VYMYQVEIVFYIVQPMDEPNDDDFEYIKFNR